MDTGNQATYKQIPIIFIKENIFKQLNNPIEFVEIETVNGINIIETIKQEIIINSQKKSVYCAKISNEYEFDALLNLKGLL